MNLNKTDILFTVFTGNKGCFDISIKTFRHSFSAITGKKRSGLLPITQKNRVASFNPICLMIILSVDKKGKRSVCHSKPKSNKAICVVKRQKCCGILWGNLSRAAAVVGHYFESFKSDDEIWFRQLTQFVCLFVGSHFVCVLDFVWLPSEWKQNVFVLLLEWVKFLFFLLNEIDERMKHWEKKGRCEIWS